VASLRAELAGETMPDFVLTLPVGWVKREPSDEERDELLRATKNRLMAVHRPDLYAQMSTMVTRMFRDMQRVETVAYFMPGPDAPDEAYLPATLTASVRRGPNGTSLDDVVAGLIRTQGATALGGDKRMLRWEKEDVQIIDGVRVPTTTVVYFTPVPDTGRKRALQFTLVISHEPIETDEDRQFLDGVKAMFDSHLSTFSWKAE